MTQVLATHEFHDSESDDVYDLYNVCNGVLHNGLPDLRKLDEYSLEDRQALNVVRLREIWTHMASGCSECQAIVVALGKLRGLLRDSIETGKVS